MHLTFGPRGILQIDDARIIWPNFSGRAGTYNREGERSFNLIIDSEEIKDALLDDVNKYGISWNVKIKPPRDEEDTPLVYLPVKIRFNDYGPNIYLQTGSRTVRLDEESVSCLDDIEIIGVDMDIRPYDDEINGKPFRSAYLSSMRVIQRIDRFAAQLESEEY